MEVNSKEELASYAKIIFFFFSNRTGSEERKTMNLRPVMKRPAKPTAPRLSNQLTTNEETRQL